MCNLADAYKLNRDINLSIKLEEESLNIIEGLFSLNPNYWVDLYFTVLDQLSISYYKTKLYSKLLKVLDEQYKVSLKYKGLNHEKTKGILKAKNIIQNEL